MNSIDEDEEISQSKEEYKGVRILLSLEKSFSNRDIWTTVLNRDFILSLFRKNILVLLSKIFTTFKSY